MQIDKTDQKIIKILQLNGRTANAQIARQIGLTTSAVHERIKKLEKTGVIRSYAAVIDPQAMDKTLLAYIFLRIRPHRVARQVAAQLPHIQGIQEIAHLTGEECFMAKIRCNGTPELETILYDINEIEGVYSTRTVIALGMVVEHPSLPLAPSTTP